MTPCGHDWLPAGSDTLGRLTPRSLRTGEIEIDSPVCQTQGSLVLADFVFTFHAAPGETVSCRNKRTGKLASQGLIIWGDWLPGVLDLGEIDSLGYYTLGRLTLQGDRPWGDFEKISNLAKSVAEVDSIDEKPGGRKSRWTVPGPLKYVLSLCHKRVSLQSLINT